MTKTNNTSGNAFEYINNYIEPPQTYYYWTYPTVPSVIIEDKTKKAIDILDMFRKEKKIKIESIDSFLELVNKISKLL